eukprot:gnl/MRDRNA2_/MRDRNA2_81244_c0_seq2.p1 gnl/MRDRNA2_/MRDRNA2_81244_c0~~gnl/MRDRNA2_/MRDRNA2_81244_c0_seq2.p1  ORF type:complete len:657 (+),score=130.34 gnl/MRDRNA2_/MRDRNA2_81244_c0_seq2:267-1973(+)
MTEDEKTYAKWTMQDYINARKKGLVTCEQYTAALIKRVKHYKEMNQFMYWDNDPDWTDRVLGMAKALDIKAKKGVEEIAPFYGLPIPAKGTMATTDFYSSAGTGILHNFKAVKDSDMLIQIKKLNGIIFGKTNVPDFAASGESCNYPNGCTQSPHGRLFGPSGSSGGSGSAVASHLAPVALTEDTGGSTTGPAFMNGNFGYDPTRGHFPNAGNPGMSYILDQMGLNARTIDDVLLFDEIFQGYQSSSFPAKPLKDIKIGVPIYPFVEAYVPKGGHNPFGYAEFPRAFKPSVEIMVKYEAAKAALSKAGVSLISKEWPTSAAGNNILAEALFLTEITKGKPLSMNFDVFISYSGQIADWIKNYLNVTISPKEILEDAFGAGKGHSPASFMAVGNMGDEKNFQFIMHVLRPKAIKAWNTYFDTHGVDMILIPGMLHFQTYPCQAASTCAHHVGDLSTGVFESKAEFTAIDTLFMHTFSHKHIPFPKVMVPVGLDSAGQPLGLQFMGRSGPVDAVDMAWLFDDELLKTIDVSFLKNVKSAVDAMIVNDPSLDRANARLVQGPGNLYEGLTK